MFRVLLLKTLRDLRASLAQTLALIVIVALGIASYIAMTGGYRDLGTSYDHTYAQLDFADATFSIRGAPEGVVGRVASEPGVAAVTGRLVIDTGLELPKGAQGVTGEQIRARLIGISPDHHPEVNNVLILDGGYLNPINSEAVLLESHFGEIYHLKPGDTVTPIVNGRKVHFKVAGVVASPEYLIVSPGKQEIIPSARTFAVIFMPLRGLQQLVGADGMVNDIAVRLSPGADRDAVVQSIKDRLKPYGLEETTLQKDQPSAAALRLDLEGFQELAEMMPGLILLVAAGSVYVMLGRQVHAQHPQIGLMKALGYDNRAIVSHYLAYALLIGLVGSALGAMLGIPLQHMITQSYAGELGIPLVVSRFYLAPIVEGVLVSLVVALFAGIAPARAATHIAPVEAMRIDPTAVLVKGRATAIERVIRVPFWLRLPLRSVFRVRRRSLTTGLGVVFSFILVLMSWGMFDSMSYLTDHNFRVVERWDMAAAFDKPQPESALNRIAFWRGVNEVEPLIQLPATLRVGNQHEDVLLTVLSPTQKMHVLESHSGKPPAAALSDGQIVLTGALADKLKLHLGDRLIVDTLDEKRNMILGSMTDELMTSAAYISLDKAKVWMGAPLMFNAVYLKVDPSRATAVKKELYDLSDTASVQFKSGIENDWRTLMGLFYVFMGVVLAFALAMAFALLFNAMTVNVLERQREFATMRAVGTSPARIAMLMTAENVILWLLALVPGLLLGNWVAMQMGAAFTSDLFSFSVVIAPTSYVITALGILLTMILAALPAIRRVNRLNLAETTKMLT